MKLHWIQHVPFEGLGFIEDIAQMKGFDISSTRVFEPGHSFPDFEGLNLIVIMGGPMGVYDINEYPWLIKEKEFIRSAIKNKIKIIGICLGAQLIADVLGAKIKKNNEKEIGWFKIFPDKNYQGKLSGIFEAEPEVFHWHGDTFDIPDKSMLVCSSEGCTNQAFDYNGQVFGLQFHLETTKDSAKSLIENCNDEIQTTKKFIQAEKDIIGNESKYLKINEMMKTVFERIIG